MYFSTSQEVCEALWLPVSVTTMLNSPGKFKATFLTFVL